MDQTLKDFVSWYGQNKWLDVSSLVWEMPIKEDMWNSHIKQMSPILASMTEGEFLKFITDMIAEYNTLAIEELSAQTMPTEQVAPLPWVAPADSMQQMGI